MTLHFEPKAIRRQAQYFSGQLHQNGRAESIPNATTKTLEAGRALSKDRRKHLVHDPPESQNDQQRDPSCNRKPARVCILCGIFPQAAIKKYLQGICNRDQAGRQLHVPTR